MTTTTAQQRVNNHQHTTDLLFGQSTHEPLSSPTSTNNKYPIHPNDNNNNNDTKKPTGIAKLFFGFMYEEENIHNNHDNDENDDIESILYRSSLESTTNVWNTLNAALFTALLLNTMAECVPVAIITSVHTTLNPATFAADVTAAAVLGTALGKLINGPIVDLCGARRTSVVYSLGLALALLGLAAADTVHIRWLCAAVEFAYATQWPCAMVTLATHYRGNDAGQYEGGIYVTSMACRLGALLGIPGTNWCLRYVSWRVVALVGAWMAAVASSVTFLYVTDSPTQIDCPQNPIDTTLLQKWFPETYPKLLQGRGTTINRHRNISISTYIAMAMHILQTHVKPSLTHVLSSATFWTLAMAHTGASMVSTSVRILATYMVDTSGLSEQRANSLAVSLSLGTVLGLMIAGNAFASRKERPRKHLVAKLYLFSIVACYVLAAFGMPFWHRWDIPELVATFQVMAFVAAGFGIAVQMYHIPSLVSATFGCDKGLFCAYVDGVAYGLASLVWRIVARAVQESSAGWAYGWAAVALLLILSALLMVEFMEHYFCRQRHGDRYETMIIA